MRERGRGRLEFEYAARATPTLDAVVGQPGGVAGDPIVLAGSGFGTLASAVSVGIGGAPCAVTHANETTVACALAARRERGHVPGRRARRRARLRAARAAHDVNYTVALVIEGVAPLNGSRVGGTELTITGSGFARLGPMNNVTVGGVPCVPKTLKNLACRLSPFDSGQPCAWTSGAGAFAGAAADASQTKAYAMVASPFEDDYASRADATAKYYAEWLDFSTPQRIVCVMDDLSSLVTRSATRNASLGASVTSTWTEQAWAWRADGELGAVRVTLPGARQLVDAGESGGDALEQLYPARVATQLESATRDLHCVALAPYRIWNVAYQEDHAGGACSGTRTSRTTARSSTTSSSTARARRGARRRATRRAARPTRCGRGRARRRSRRAADRSSSRPRARPS